MHKSVNAILAERGLQDGGRVQKYIDSTVLRLCAPYVPFLSGQLKVSGIRGTVIGSGLVVYRAPYARRQYYANSGNGKQGTSRGGLRGRYWFARMKADRGQEIIQGAAKIAGGEYLK
ncbi:MAG: capsid protein [Clostridia bacterium]|nr:capsid protein [Clostridia bacterium]